MATSGWENLTEADVARMGRQGPKSPISSRSSHVKSPGKGKVAPPSSKAQLGADMPQKRRSKYGAVKTSVDVIVFASKAEARRYSELKLLVKAGEISGLLLQPVYRLFVKPMVGPGEYEQIGKYIGDFQYYAKDGATIVEDVKGMRTLPLAKWKMKHAQHQYGITVREIRYRR